MIQELNIVHVDPKGLTEFENAFAKARELLLHCPGCLGAGLLRSIEVAGKYLVRVDWAELSDHVDRYPASAIAPQVRALLAPHIKAIDPGHFQQVAP
ncbi:antibiotic biosynthesis monooxygenase [Sphingobium sp.]|uniref:antibiotic biosynthesis monooxygenase family protein n=1 Tax=Sphingobium sp. TaxID=1912891 RepID=UPI0028BD2FE9|nr:antibiotic biosynthesis monooxygenase [Sphingobium sp.]